MGYESYSDIPIVRIDLLGIPQGIANWDYDTN